jgi:hypothetical protein
MCNQWVDSPIQFRTAEAFFTSEPAGNEAHCSWCGQITPYNIENMRFEERSDEGMRTYIEGKAATKT